MKKPIIFVQDCGTYTDEILVCIGASKKQILAYCKKEGVKKNFTDWISTDEAIFDVLKKSKAAYAWNDGVQGTILLLKSYEDTWDFWETLLHELHHMVHVFSRRKIMQEEMEGQAYLQE